MSAFVRPVFIVCMFGINSSVDNLGWTDNRESPCFRIGGSLVSHHGSTSPRPGPQESSYRLARFLIVALFAMTTSFPPTTTQVQCTHLVFMHTLNAHMFESVECLSSIKRYHQ